MQWAAGMLADPEMAGFMKTIYGMPDDVRGPMLDFAANLLLVLYRIPDPERRREVMKRMINFEHLGGEG